MSENRSHWTRKNVGAGEKLLIRAEITEEEINQLGDGYWMLKVGHFDRSGAASCKVVIEY